MPLFAQNKILKKKYPGQKISSVNWHITSACNYNCIFCYTQKLQGNIKTLEHVISILGKLADLGIEKINFVGGEPLIHPMIYDILKAAKDNGFTVALTTNGSLLSEQSLSRISLNVDWIGLSVDSALEEIEEKLGRGNGNHVSHCLQMADLIHNMGISIKINTTVTKLNYQEDMSMFISQVNPERWKIFQFLHIVGQNDNAVETLSIDANQFMYFKKINESISLSNGTKPVFESEKNMIDSYFMLAPSGNVFTNHEQKYTEIPLALINANNLPCIINLDKYVDRGGFYEW